MKTFLAIYTGTPGAMDAWRSLPEAERKEREARGIQGWHDWAERNKSSIADMGGPVGRTKRVTKEGVADVRNNIGAYTVVCAESHEAAARLFLSHPHFAIFPGDGVEIMECLPIPNR
jgi:hypothetical protein